MRNTTTTPPLRWPGFQGQGPEVDPVALAEAPYATGGANVPPAAPAAGTYTRRKSRRAQQAQRRYTRRWWATIEGRTVRS